jgi:hypothetical protein
MDGLRIDSLAKGLAKTPLNRALALRCLVTGVAALSGLTLAGELGMANKNHKREKRVTVCECVIGDSSSRQPTKVRQSKLQIWLIQHPCSYRGECQVPSPPCPVF